jgi:hypothetical protein
MGLFRRKKDNHVNAVGAIPSQNSPVSSETGDTRQPVDGFGRDSPRHETFLNKGDEERQDSEDAMSVSSAKLKVRLKKSFSMFDKNGRKKGKEEESRSEVNLSGVP